MDTVLRYILSMTAIGIIAGIIRFDKEVKDIVYYILGGAVFGLNGKELVGIIDFIRGKK